MKIQRYFTHSFPDKFWLLAVGILLAFSSQSHAQCDTLLTDNVGMRLRIWHADLKSPGDTVDFSESLKRIRNFKVVRTLVADTCPKEQIDALMADLEEASGKITAEEKANLRKQQPGPWARIGVIIRFKSAMSLSHLFTTINRFPRFFIEVDLINNEILVTMPI